MKTPTELVAVERNVPFTTSDIIAEHTNNSYRSIQRTIERHEKQLEMFGRVRFEITPFETKGGIQNKKIYHLNEQQATFLVTLLRNSEEVIAFKVNLVKQFYEMRELLTQKKNADWAEARAQGKLERKELTDAIKDFTEYAVKNGSKHADKYYIHFTNIVRSATQISDRALATPRQLIILMDVETLLTKNIQDGMAQELPYKDIFRSAKCAVNDYVGRFGFGVAVGNRRTALAN